MEQSYHFKHFTSFCNFFFQVCNLAWSKHSNELVNKSFYHLKRLPFSSIFNFSFFLCRQVSTHGYSQNQILVWKYPSLTQVAKLTGHSFRVLYLVSTCSSFDTQVSGDTQVPFDIKVLSIPKLFPSSNFFGQPRDCSKMFALKAVSPDGEAIVTGAGDETLRFWNVFNKARSHKVLLLLLLLFQLLL